MVDYLELFSKMLDEENGEQKVADYLTKVTNSVNEAMARKREKSQKQQAIEELTEILTKHYGGMKIFTYGEYRPRDAIEAMLQALEVTEKLVVENDDIADWLRGVK